MSFVNALLRGLCDALLYPFRELPPLVGLVVVSLVTAIAMLLVFKITSDQEGIGLVKRRIHAGLFEIRLFKDDLRAILRAQAEILRHNLTYLRLSAAPLLWMIVPLVLFIGQLHFHYGYRALEPGEQVLLEVKLKSGSDEAAASVAGRPAVSLEVPSGLKVETDPVWIPFLKEMSWRLSAQEWGDYELLVGMGGQTFSKTVRVSRAVLRSSPVRPDRGFFDQLIYPAETPLPKSSPIESITLSYPDSDMDVFGVRLHWMVVFFILSIVFAFALRNRFGVTI
jgi:uncharacterized membrane protein (DUF106 family)